MTQTKLLPLLHHRVNQILQALAISVHGLPVSCKSGTVFTFLNENKDMNEHSWSHPNLKLQCLVGEATMQMFFQLLPPQLICKDVMLITSPNCLCESCTASSRGFGVVGVLLPDVFGKKDENMEDAMWGSVSRSWLKRIFLGAKVVVGKGELLCLAPALGCPVCHSGGTAPDATSIITWLHPAWRWKTFFSCVLSLGSCLVSFYGWGRCGSLSCRAARCVVQPHVSPGYPSMRQGL